MRRIIMASITAVVVIAVLAGTLIPVLDDATEQERTFTNDGYYRMSEVTTSDTETIVWEATAPTSFTINGTEYDMADYLPTGSLYFSLFVSDGAYMRVKLSATDTIVVQINNTSGTSMGAFDSSNTTFTSLTLTVSEGTITVVRDTDGTEATSSTTFSDWGYIFDEEGDYTMKDSSSSAYVLADSSIILAGVTSFNGTSVAVHGTGTVESITIESIYPDDDTTYSDIVIDATADDEFEDLYSLTKITFNGTRSDVTTAATYSYFLVPYEVTADKIVQFTDGENAILNAIPVLVIVALLLSVIALVLRSRMD